MRELFSQLIAWKFDPISPFLTMILVPTGIYIVYAIRKFLKDAISYIVDGLVYALNKIVVHRVAASLTLKRYCRLQLAGPTKTLRIPSSIEISVEIDQIFIPLVLENAGFGTAYNSSSLLDAGNRIRIIGDPGSGKSSAAKRLFRDECQRAVAMPAKSRFPVFIELRNLEIPKSIPNSKLGEWVLNYIRNFSAKNEVYNLKKCFDIYASTSGLLVIFDGLDEVSSPNYPRICSALNAFAQYAHQLGEHNFVVITLRTQFHQQIRAHFDDSYPAVLSVKRFSPADIYEFLTRWPFRNSRFETVVRIYNDLTDRPSLREMCTNPLVLSMYVAQDQISGDQIAPDSRTQFYSEVTNELVIRRRAKQIGAPNAQAVVREQRQRVLGRIALDHLCDPDQAPNHLIWENAVRVVMETLKYKQREKAIAYLRELSKETGLIGEEQEGESFRFIHLTFCEFFCAYEAVHGTANGWSGLLAAHKQFQGDPALRARLIEVLPFAAALLPRHMRDEAINQIGSYQDIHLLAMTFLETKNYEHHLWPKLVDASISNLKESARDHWDADWLRELHLFLVVASDAERAAEVASEIARSDAVTLFFEEFGKNEAGTLSKLIYSYAEQDASAAFRVASLCEIDLLNDVPGVVVASCSQPPFIAVALERAMREPELAKIWASLFAEGGLRSRAAADALARRAERPWKANVDEIPWSNRWTNSILREQSFYTDCINLAYHSGLNHRATPLLNILAKVPAPNSYSALANLCMRAWFPTFIVTYLSFPLMVIGSRSRGREEFLILLAIAPIAMLILLLGILAGRRVQLYESLLNRRLSPTFSASFLRGVALGMRTILLFQFSRFRREARVAPLDGPLDPFRGKSGGGELQWAGFACPGVFRPKSLIEPARQLFTERATML